MNISSAIKASRLTKRFLPKVSFLLVASAYSGAAMVHAQEIFLDRDDLTQAQVTEFDTKLREFKSNEKTDVNLTGLVGSFAGSYTCPIGYVENLDVKFSIKDIQITQNEGAKCEGKSCRSWKIQATPGNLKETYAVDIKLKCSDDDTLVVRTRDGKRGR